MILPLLFAFVANFVAPALAEPGVFHSAEVAVRDGERVLVLVEKSPMHCALEEQRVRVSTVKSSPDLSGDEPGKKVSLKNESEVVQIIARVPGLVAGEVETVSASPGGPETRENPLTFTFHGVVWRIELIGNDLVVTDGIRKQILAHNIDKEKSPNWDLVWCGDMDHDGKVDLLYQIRGDNFDANELALSSAARRKGELMRVVARDDHVGC